MYRRKPTSFNVFNTPHTFNSACVEGIAGRETIGDIGGLDTFTTSNSAGIQGDEPRLCKPLCRPRDDGATMAPVFAQFVPINRKSPILHIPNATTWQSTYHEPSCRHKAQPASLPGRALGSQGGMSRRRSPASPRPGRMRQMSTNAKAPRKAIEVEARHVALEQTLQENHRSAAPGGPNLVETKAEIGQVRPKFGRLHQQSPSGSGDLISSDILSLRKRSSCLVLCDR